MLLRIGQNAVGKGFRIRRGERRHIERAELAVHADARRAIGGDVEVAASHLDHLLQQLAQRDSGHAPVLRYNTVSRRTSSIVGNPAATLIKPLRRKVIMPCSMAFFLSSRAEAPTRISSRRSSLISMTSYRPVRPLYPPLLQVVQPLP